MMHGPIAERDQKFADLLLAYIFSLKNNATVLWIRIWSRKMRKILGLQHQDPPIIKQKSE
jgi:hypothetical protein